MNSRSMGFYIYETIAGTELYIDIINLFIIVQEMDIERISVDKSKKYVVV